MINLDTNIKKQRYNFDNKGLYSQSYGFSSIHVQMWVLDHKEGWAPKNCSFYNVVLEKTLESPLHNKIKPVNPKGNQPWIHIGRTDMEAEAPILWPPNVKSQFIGKDPNAGKDWGQEKVGDRGWEGWMASGTQWTRVWANSGRERKTGKPDKLQSMESQRVGQALATERHIKLAASTSSFLLWVSPHSLCHTPVTLSISRFVSNSGFIGS